jgi:hypothetical protein
MLQVEPPTAVTSPPSPSQPNFKAPTPKVSETAKELPSKVSAGEVKQQSQRHALGNAMRGGAMSHDAIKAQSRKYGNTW